MEAYFSNPVRIWKWVIAGLGQLLVMPTRTGLFPAFHASSLACRPTCCLKVAGWLLQLYQESRGSTRSYLLVIIGQKWCMWPLLTSAWGAGSANIPMYFSSLSQGKAGWVEGMGRRVGKWGNQTPARRVNATHILVLQTES